MGLKPRPTAPRKQFGPELFGFLIEVAINNNREWFAENKEFYESAVKSPLLGFIENMAPELAKISPHFRCDARSMFRIYRDVRFSKDKRPYKTHAAAHFRHAAGKDVHAPGFYVHLEPGSVFVAGGMWRPASEPLARIRKRIASSPKKWQAVLADAHFAKHCELSGSSLKRVPRGFDAEHPLISDIKRKDFIAVVELRDEEVLSKDFHKRVAKAFGHLAPMNKFICDAVGVPF